MNSSVHEKDWHLQSPSLAEGAPTHPQPHHIQHYSPALDHPYAQSFPQGGPMHPPLHQQPPSSNYLPLVKPESDPRLPGMMALSQPGTPRPAHTNGPESSPVKKSHVAYSTSSFHATPYPHPSITRKRGRNESLFSAELGPFFSSTKPFDNLYALDRNTLLNIRIQSKMDRGFFLADNDWTCYRRNYFQVSSAFTIHGVAHYYADHETQCLVQADGAFYPVRRFLLNVSARVSNSDKKIELVQHTPKRDKGPQTTPLPKPIIP
ncbi:p53-like transcription factor, partial [Phycomyces blakesleeanus NRRL 1555(-)]